MTEPLRLRGVFGVLPTAFRADASLDLAGTVALVRANREAGAAGVTVLGVMGEAAELTEDERRQVVAAVVASAAPLAVIVGVSGESRELRLEPGTRRGGERGRCADGQPRAHPRHRRRGRGGGGR